MKSLLVLALLAALAGCAGGLPLHTPPQTDAAVQHLVSEDDQVRIDELRVRGQTQRLAVQPKSPQGRAAPGYEILPASGGQDPSGKRDAAGQRVWPVLSF